MLQTANKAVAQSFLCKMICIYEFDGNISTRSKCIVYICSRTKLPFFGILMLNSSAFYFIFFIGFLFSFVHDNFNCKIQWIKIIMIRHFFSANKKSINLSVFLVQYLLFHCNFASLICLQTESGVSFQQKIRRWTI